MTPTFTINFRREAYREALARTRRRTVALGAWVAYFGVLGLTLGLYGLNCTALTARTRLLTAQNARIGAAPSPAPAWKPAASELDQVERALANPRRWQVRLARLAALLPPNASLSAVAVNPDNVADAASRERLMITGSLRPTPGQDHMQGLSQLVAALRKDAAFSAHYRTIKLVESRIEGGGVDVQFRIECR